MPDIGWSELLILGIVALICIGPKDLPVFLRTLGKYTGALRRQAAEFRAHFDAAMREAEMDGVQRDLESVARDMKGAFADVGTPRAAPTIKPMPEAETQSAEAKPEAEPVVDTARPLAPDDSRTETPKPDVQPVALESGMARPDAEVIQSDSAPQERALNHGTHQNGKAHTLLSGGQ